MSVVIDVNSESTFNDAISLVDGTATVPGNYTIDLTSNITLASGALEALNLQNGVTVTIDGDNGSGGSFALNGNGTQRGLFVYQGSVTIENLVIRNTQALGGNGGTGGGGGAGLGGGLFIAGTGVTGAGTGGTVTLANVTFLHNTATGGAGGGANSVASPTGAGGGGGLGGNGGLAEAGVSTNGGGGPSGGGGGGGVGSYGLGGGGGGGIGAAGGNGGAPGDAGLIPNAPGGGSGASTSSPNAGTDGGGGGGGVDGSASIGVAGANGGFGGGGGGGGVTSGPGGAGGFGGGGGGEWSISGTGGDGGFGGGGGGGGVAGTSLFGGGTGANQHDGSTPNPSGGAVAGGGGLGAGGDIFVEQGGRLTIETSVLNVGTVNAGGSGGAGASAGRAFGSGIFLQGRETITIGAGQTIGQTTTISGVIADENGSVSGSTTGTGGGLIIAGDGSVVLGADNSFTGGIHLNSGTVDLATAGAGGSGTITFGGASASLNIEGGTAPTNIIANFVTTDAIDLSGIAYDAGDVPNYVTSTGELDIINAGSTVASLFFGVGNTIVNDPFHINQDNGTGILITNDAPCFCLGTRILTDRGEVAVEDLLISDIVVTANQRHAPIRWIGRRTLDLTRHPRPDRIRPIRIRANAFADGAPSRDLFVSPDHALVVDGMLIPAKLLINGASILRDAACVSTTYFHVELETHDILLAENLPAESYVDTGNRGMFENAFGPLQLHPDFINDQARREAKSCLPFADEAARTEPVWRALAARTARLGLPFPHPSETADHPVLGLWIEGRHVKPISVVSGHYVFLLPKGAAEMRLRSGGAVANERQPWISDDRYLGVMVRGLTLHSGTSVSPVALDDPSLDTGWWQPEWHGPTTLCRWTNGDALVRTPNACLTGPGPYLLEVEVAGTMGYSLPAYGGPGPVDKAA